MSKYDRLDARRELEQQIAEDLKKALEKRGFSVRHNGTKDSHAPAGKPDIEVWNNHAHINVEVTKSTKSNQDREWQSIKDHFEETKRNYTTKNCFVWFISPETYYRTINSMKDWNFVHENDADQKMMPICFSTFELFAKKLIETTKDEYTKEQILGLHNDFVQFIDDENILRHFHQKLFSDDKQLREKIEKKEEERHQRVVEELVIGFKRLEQKLRDERIVLGPPAIKNVIYLVFIKLYEEKKEKEEGERNRFTLSTFKEYQVNTRESKKAIHKLFNDLKTDPDIKDCKLLTDDDRLSKRLTDDFVIEHFIKPFEQYTFYTTKVDGLGAAYEVLGKLSGKDTTAGQFFTPENVVKFMVRLAELDPEDVVFDPACGTARFLTYAMEEMEKKVIGQKDEGKKIKHIREEQLFGTDDDPTVAKLAKMNMYIHGDGRTNIKDEDGLTQFDMDEKVDAIMTNPPLGDISYQRSIYDDNFKKNRLTVIPKKNITKERLNLLKERVKKLQQQKDRQNLSLRKARNIQKRIKNYEREIAELQYKIDSNQSDFRITGKQMKGGALFLNACKYYLRNVRDSNALPEWRGGKLLIILDEGILNTETYKEVCDFIRRNFYIKAIISLTRDTFVPVSNTTTKTSILYAIKKEDLDAIQKEPIFYAHAEKVGLDTRKKICANHLFNDGTDILSKYKEFKEKVLSSYHGLHFNREQFLKLDFSKGEIHD